MTESVDVEDLKSSAVRRAGSSPARGTILKYIRRFAGIGWRQILNDWEASNNVFQYGHASVAQSGQSSGLINRWLGVQIPSEAPIFLQ